MKRVASELDITYNKLMGWFYSGRFPASKLDGRWYVHRDDVAALRASLS